jgi:hypothetical protein
MPGSRKRQRRATGNEDINQLCWDWFQEATGRRINISGPLIQEQALKFAKDLGVDRQLFPPSHRFITFTLSSKCKGFLVTMLT